MTDHTRRAVDNGTLARLDNNPVLSLSFKIMGALVAFVVVILGWNAQGIVDAQTRIVETVSVIDRNQAVIVQRLGEHDRRIDNVERRVWPGGSAFTTP